MRRHHLAAALIGLSAWSQVGCVQRAAARPEPAPTAAAEWKARYEKREVLIPMRDGVKLFTAIYSPRAAGRPRPILLNRSPYSVAPYGADFRDTIGPSTAFTDANYIVVYQDVRGCFMSEGTFVDMRPHIDRKSGPADVDESSDTYDTVDWLVRNVPGNNGRVGLWGISYPGFYAAAGAIDSHPALKAVSPQAPIADWFVGDDFHHNGAFFLMDGFGFFASFGLPRPVPTTQWHPRFPFGTGDAYRFFLDLGPLSNANTRFLKGDSAFWNDMMTHGTYDDFWKARNILPHLRNVRAAVMTVGGWFDAEDLYGPLHIYKEIEGNNPGIENTLVLGPWTHGGWARNDGESLGDMNFGGKQSLHYRANVELPFFNRHLDGGTGNALPEAIVFCTGSNKWLAFDRWPPPDAVPVSFYFAEDGRLQRDLPTDAPAFDEYLSDPSRPVPYTQAIRIDRGHEFMTEDQRFAARRPDVLTYSTPVLEHDLAIAGPIEAELFVTTSGSDADFVVKVIDVQPEDGGPKGAAQLLLRAEVMRAKFRNSLENPEPLKPGEVTKVRFELRDVCHTFRRGHRLMVQVQSTWFPLVDRNPQTFVDIYSANEAVFVKSTIQIHRSPDAASRIIVGTRGE